LLSCACPLELTLIIDCSSESLSPRTLRWYKKLQPPG
jgi:hypothetical protein